MKFSITLLTLLLFISFRSASQKIDSLQGVKSSASLLKESFSAEPFILINNNGQAYRERLSSLSNTIDKFSLLDLAADYAEIQKKIKNADRFILQLPEENGRRVKLVMQKHEITSPGFVVRTSEGKTLTNISSIGNHFTGEILTSTGEKSLSAISFNTNGIQGFISDKSGNHVIESLPQDKTGLHILYNDKDFKEKRSFNCLTPEAEKTDEGISKQSGNINTGNLTCKTVKIYVECTYEMYLAHNSNVNEVIDFVLSMFNASATIFKNDGINIQISELFIWTRPDVYSGVGSQISLLYEFQYKLLRDYQNGIRINGDIAHIVTPVYLGGAVSSGYGIINNCGKSNGMLRCAASSGIYAFPALPAFSYAVYYFAHETGHMLGSRHTQSCTWPGGAIDNCFTPEGSCPPGPAPLNGGTVMSYCNSTPYGINFLNGFGPLPSAFMRDHIESVPCLSLCRDTICDTKLNNVSAEITGSYIKLKWINQAPKYKIGLRPNTTQQWQYFEVINTDSFRLNKTNCETFYDFSITAFCTSQNKYGTEYISGIGDTAAYRLSIIPVGPAFISDPYSTIICPGFTNTISVTRYNDFVYRWFNSGVLQPQSDSSSIIVAGGGRYHAMANAGGCTYYSDSITIIKSSQSPRIIANITGQKVVFSVASTCTVSRFWDFGDGQFAWGLPQTHIYNAKGLYNVTVYVKAADSSMEQVSRKINIGDEFIDSLDTNSRYGLSRSIAFSDFSCRNAAVFTRDSLNKNGTNSLNVGLLNYFSSAGNTLFETPKTGTLEFKLYPQRGLVKLASEYSIVQSCDTGFVLNALMTSFDNHSTFSFLFNSSGGVRVCIDSIVLGSVGNAVTGPLKINKWNHVGISYGSQGIKVWVNGQEFASSPHVIDSATAANLGRFVFGTNLGYMVSPPDNSAARYFKSFEGAIDLIRFSLKQNDFTFSLAPAWQGVDTTFIKKQVCYGDTYLGYGSTGRYFTHAVNAQGCDSITQIDLLVNDQIKITDSLIHPVNNNSGNIFVNSISEAIEPLKYKWNTGDTTRHLLNVAAGKYTLTVTDALNCAITSFHPLYNLQSSADWITLYPNPVEKNGDMFLRIGAVAAKNYYVVIYDVLGRKYFQQTLHVNAGVTETAIPQKLMKGIYVLYLSHAKEKHAIRFIVN